MSRKAIITTPEGSEKGSISTRLRRRATVPALWIWASFILVGGVMIALVVSATVAPWIKHFQLPAVISQVLQDQNAQPAATPIVAQSLAVQRTAPYAGLAFTVLNAQYASAFADDPIQAGAALLRLNLRVANPTTLQVKLLYYDIARLLIPRQNPVAPTNMQLSPGLAPGKSESGWLDFPVSNELQLNQLALQLGSSAQHEQLVTIPLTGSFDPHVYADSTSAQSLFINYNFLGHFLSYHLTSVNVSYAFQGYQCHEGTRFYILNFQVDNRNSLNVSPGYAFDYIRLALNGSVPPADATLPDTFKANSYGTSGQVAFFAPPGLNSLTISFLPQTGAPAQSFSVQP